MIKEIPVVRSPGPRWYCKCDCGNNTTASTQSLRKGSTKSCGCLRDETRPGRKGLKPGESALNCLYRHYQRKAKKREIDFSLTRDGAIKLFLANCHYCGREPHRLWLENRNIHPTLYNGIDRVDTNGPYADGNVVACCKDCNYAKHDMPLPAFKDHIQRLYERFFGG